MQQGVNKMSHDAFDRRTMDWYVDKLMQSLVFIGGISAIIFHYRHICFHHYGRYGLCHQPPRSG